MLRRVAATTTVMIYCQIILGATMRHMNAGMAPAIQQWRMPFFNSMVVMVPVVTVRSISSEEVIDVLKM
jgi:heme A synthase